MSGNRSGEETSAIPLFLLSDDLEIVHGWPHVQLFQHAVLPVVLCQAGNTALGIIEIAEDDRARRARLLTGGVDVAILERRAVALGFDLGFLDALHTEGAFLHNPARTHGDIGIQHQVCQAVFARVVEPVEAACFVRTIVGAVPSADAAVVDLLVQTLVAVDGGESGADRLARRVFALLAHHRLVGDFDLIGRAGVVTVDADPVHLAAAADFVAADYRRVVLHLARQPAAGAAP